MELVLTRVDGALSVNPAPPYLIEYLQYYHRGFKVERYKRVNDFQLKLLHQVDADGTLITFAGFFDQICSLCQKNGDVVRVVDQRAALPLVNWQAIRDINWQAIGSTGLRDYQFDPIAEFLSKAQVTSGIVNATGGFGKTVVQAVTYAAFNSLNTILAIPLKEVFSQTYDKFRVLFPNKHIGRVGGGFHDISPDITITTFKSLKSCSIEKCKLLLIDELQSTAGEEVTTTLCSMHPTRIFGYTATDEGMFNKAEKLIKGLFGERLIHIPYQETEEAGGVVPMSVWFVRTSPEWMVDAATMEGKLRKGINQCKPRNELIGRICASIPKGRQTLLFVDKVIDHLIPLHKELPLGTRYIHRDASKASAGSYALTPKQQRETIKAYQDNEFQFMMATDAFRAGVDIPNCRITIQASGGCSEVELLQEAYRTSRILPSKLQEALGVPPKTHGVLVDIMDVHDPALQSMSLKRKDIYERQGWTVREVDSPEKINWDLFQPSKNMKI